MLGKEDGEEEPVVWNRPGEHRMEGEEERDVNSGLRIPKAWGKGNRDCVAESADLDPGHQEFLLAGHINLNKSPSAAAMFAKHQADEAARFKLDKKR